jgi:hypothetical protein
VTYWSGVNPVSQRNGIVGTSFDGLLTIPTF